MARLRYVLRLVAIFLATLFAALLVLDLVEPYVVVSLGVVPNARVLIIDIAGIVDEAPCNARVVKGLSIDLFRVLGASDASIIVFVGHGMVIKSSLFVKGFALESSECPSPFIVLRHPLLVLTEAVMRGKVWSENVPRVAITKNMLAFSHPWNGKVIVIATCGLSGIDDFAKEFVHRGAKLVVFTNRIVSKDEITTLVRIASCSKNLREMLRKVSMLDFVDVVGGEYKRTNEDVYGDHSEIQNTIDSAPHHDALDIHRIGLRTERTEFSTLGFEPVLVEETRDILWMAQHLESSRPEIRYTGVQRSYKR